MNISFKKGRIQVDFIIFFFFRLMSKSFLEIDEEGVCVDGESS